MNKPYLEVTYRHGKPLAAYLYLSRQAGDKAAYSQPVDDLLVVDHAADGRPIGIEILAPGSVTLGGLNSLMRSLHLPEIEPAEFKPLQVA
jgi:hypothetical protein